MARPGTDNSLTEGLGTVPKVPRRSTVGEAAAFHVALFACRGRLVDGRETVWRATGMTPHCENTTDHMLLQRRRLGQRRGGFMVGLRLSTLIRMQISERGVSLTLCALSLSKSNSTVLLTLIMSIRVNLLYYRPCKVQEDLLAISHKRQIISTTCTAVHVPTQNSSVAGGGRVHGSNKGHFFREHYAPKE